MKKLFITLTVLSVLFTACKKELNTPMITLMERIDTTALPQVNGNFINGPWGSVSGKAKVVVKDGKYSLVLEEVTISNGPDLHVYLSKEVMPVNFIDLGKLKATNGTQIYEIPGTPDLTKYKYALVHCQLYNHLFGSAILQ